MIWLLPALAFAAPPTGTFEVASLHKVDQPAPSLLDLLNAEGMKCIGARWTVALDATTVTTELEMLCPNMDETGWQTCSSRASGPRPPGDGALLVLPPLETSTKVVHLVGNIASNKTQSTSCNTSFGPLAGVFATATAGATLTLGSDVVDLVPAGPKPDWQALIPR